MWCASKTYRGEPPCRSYWSDRVDRPSPSSRPMQLQHLSFPEKRCFEADIRRTTRGNAAGTSEPRGAINGISRTWAPTCCTQAELYMSSCGAKSRRTTMTEEPSWSYSPGVPPSEACSPRPPLPLSTASPTHTAGGDEADDTAGSPVLLYSMVTPPLFQTCQSRQHES